MKLVPFTFYWNSNANNVVRQRNNGLRKTITLPEVCGHYSFEKFLLNYRSAASRESELELDFTELRWIGLLPLSLLYGWIQRLRRDGVAISILLPDHSSEWQVFRMLSGMGFLQALKALDVAIGGNLPVPSRGTVAVFQRFGSDSELKAYERALASAGRPDDLLGGGSDLDLVASGDFREILLHELGENAFSHGRGRGVRLLVTEQAARERPDRGGFESFFDGKPTLEVIVSDEGPGLVTTLRSRLLDDWVPPYEGKSSLSIGALTCSYALEFSSTSDPAARKERLRQVYNSNDDFEEAIPTGLFYVATLVRRYGGQLIIRTARFCVSVDYTDPSQVTIKENPIERQGASVAGTHVLVRVPRDAKGNLHKTARSSRSVSQAKICEGVEPTVLEEVWLTTNREPHSFLLQIEQTIERLLSPLPKIDGNTLVFLANGLSADTKTVSMLLAWLGTIPHRGWLILVCGLSEKLHAAATSQSALIAQLRSAPHARFLGWQPFPVTGDESGTALQFGASGLDDLEPVDFCECYTAALTHAVKRLLQREPVHHVEKPNRYYLIEGKYYTQYFYEVRQLTSPELNPLGSALAAALVVQWVRTREISAIFTVAEPLVEFTHVLARLLPTTRCLARHSTIRDGSFIHEFMMHDRSRKCLLLTDVVCTSQQLTQYFAMTPAIENCQVAAFVDGRDSVLNYITATRSDRAHAVPVLAPFRRKIPAIADLPHEEGIEILLIDQRTHAPTPRDEIGDVQLGPLDLLEAAGQARALLHGHFEVAKKHYVDLVDLPGLFESMQSRLEQFWSKTLKTLAEHKIALEQISVLYLHEKMGWEHLVPRFMATKAVAECRPIYREDLFAPRADGEAHVKGKCVWFILPVIASGTTTRRCLEYAARMKPSAPEEGDMLTPARIVISAVLGRMAPSELAFYQGVSGYRRSQVQIEVLSFVPLPAYTSENECPICITLRSFEINLRRIENCPSLYRFATEARGELEVSDISEQSPADGRGHSPDAAALAQMSALFEHGLRDIMMRKRLAELLDTNTGPLNFLEMVGAHCDAARFSRSSVQTALYTRYELMRERTRLLLESPEPECLTTHRLLGAHILFPDLLTVEIKWLLSSAIQARSDAVVARLVLLMLIDPQRYGAVAAVAAHMTDNPPKQYVELLRELANCHLWFKGTRASGLEAFEHLLWQLRRSTDWGSGLEALRTVIKTYSDTETIRTAFRKFELMAINTLFAKVLTIRSSDQSSGLWSAVAVEGGDPDAQVDRISVLTQEMRALLSANPEDLRDEMLMRLDDLDQSGQTLANSLERLYTNVGDAVEQVSLAQRFRELNKADLTVEFEIARDQPGVLFGVTHLTRLLEAFLENVAHYMANRASAEQGTAPKRWVKFFFKGFSLDRQAAVLEIYDNIPFDNPLVPTGGLKQVEEHCGVYGTLCTREPEPSNVTSARVLYLFRIDRSARTYDRNKR